MLMHIAQAPGLVLAPLFLCKAKLLYQFLQLICVFCTTKMPHRTKLPHHIFVNHKKCVSCDDMHFLSTFCHFCVVQYLWRYIGKVGWEGAAGSYR